MKTMLITLALLATTSAFSQSGISDAWYNNTRNEEIYSENTACPTLIINANEVENNTKVEGDIFIKKMKDKVSSQLEEWSCFKDDADTIITMPAKKSNGHMEEWHFSGNVSPRKW